MMLLNTDYILKTHKLQLSVAKQWKTIYGIITLKKYNKRALSRHASIRAPTPFVFESLCSVLLHMLLFFSSCYQDGYNRPSLKPHMIIFRFQETKARKLNTLLNASQWYYLLNMLSLGPILCPEKYSVLFGLTWIPLDLSGLPLEYIYVTPEVYRLSKRLDNGICPTMNNPHTFLLIHLANSLCSVFSLCA